LTIGTGRTGDEDRQAVLDRLVERLGHAVAVAGEAGMTLALETHAGSIAVYPEVDRELVTRCPGLKLTYDPSHFIADCVPVEETLDLLNHAAHVHLRNARVGHFQETMDRGLLDIPWIIDRILESGWDTRCGMRSWPSSKCWWTRDWSCSEARIGQTYTD
jgi:sugar phosphate isomerase/epimerase